MKIIITIVNEATGEVFMKHEAPIIDGSFELAEEGFGALQRAYKAKMVQEGGEEVIL